MPADDSSAAQPSGNPDITLIVPFGQQGRRVKVKLPAEVAAWLRDELVRAVGAPKPRRRPRISRGRWLR